MFKKFKLVKDWKEWKKWLSVRFTLIGTTICSSWLFIPEDLKKSIPQDSMVKIALSLFVMIFLGRMIDQNKGSKK